MSVFRKIFRAFAANRRGNVAIIYALSLLPLALASGAAIDFARAITVRASIAEGLDAAALAVGSSTTLTETQKQAVAQQYFTANYHEDSSYGTPAPIQLTPNGQSIVLTTSISMPTTFLRLAGIETMTVPVSTTVVWGQSKLWVALVLDNTGSMCQSDAYPNASNPCSPPNAGSKIAVLKNALNGTTGSDGKHIDGLLDMLKNVPSNPGDVKVSIIPFVKDVNVGTGNVGASWLDWTDWDSVNGSCSVTGKNSKSTCEAKGSWTAGYCDITSITDQSTCTNTKGVWANSKCSIPSKTSKNSCQNAYGTWTSAYCSVSGYYTQASCQAGGVWTVSSHSNWNGCVADRGYSDTGTPTGPDLTYNYDVMNSGTVTGRPTSYFPPEQYNRCPKSLLGLSYDWTALKDKVTAMVANGSTNQTIGLVWGWHSLSQGDPLSPGALPDGTARYIIILSDGLNTENRWNGDGVHQSTEVDGRMSEVCKKAKADGIVVYAVFVDIGGTQGNSKVLEECATDAGKYKDLKTASEITSALHDIGVEITNLHIAQ